MLCFKPIKPLRSLTMFVVDRLVANASINVYVLSLGLGRLRPAARACTIPGDLPHDAFRRPALLSANWVMSYSDFRVR